MKDSHGRLINKIGDVSRNDTEEAINNILDAVTKHMNDKAHQQMEIYFMTMDAIKSVNVTLWFKVSLRLGKIYLDMNNFDSLNELLASLKMHCRRREKDTDQIMESVGAVDDYDPAKSNLLLETFSLEIQMCQVTKDKKRMSRVYPKTTKLIAVINDPRVMGIIKECGGKMYMAEKKWILALSELNDCFKNYQEGGNVKAKNVLVYVILSSILANSEVDYMASREAQVYSDDRDIVAITKLKNAYRNNDIKMIQYVLNDKKNTIFSDPEFIMYLDDLLRNIRLSVLLFKVKPYDVVKLDFLARELNISTREVRQLLSELILDSKLNGAIDATAGLLEISKPTSLDARYAAMSKWSNSIATLYKVSHTEMRHLLKKEDGEDGLKLEKAIFAHKRSHDKEIIAERENILSSKRRRLDQGY